MISRIARLERLAAERKPKPSGMMIVHADGLARDLGKLLVVLDAHMMEMLGVRPGDWTPGRRMSELLADNPQAKRWLNFALRIVAGIKQRGETVHRDPSQRIPLDQSRELSELKEHFASLLQRSTHA
jgi:hypothetical protein